jgi:hypothetical protein
VCSAVLNYRLLKFTREASLQDRSVDLVIGGIAYDHGEVPVLNDYDFVEWSREGFCLLTNLSPRLFPAESITWDELRRYSLILPEAGIIIDAVRKWYGEDYQRKLKLQPPILDVHYASELLLTQTVEGFMVSTESLAKRLTADAPQLSTKRGDAWYPRLSKLRAIRLGSGFQPLDIVSGLFGRKGERAMYKQLDRYHPLVLFWEVFEQHAADYRNLLSKKRRKMI